MARFFDAKKHGDLQKQATTESDSFSQLKTQIYANVAPRFEKTAALHQSNQVLALTTAILLFKLGLTVKRPHISTSGDPLRSQACASPGHFDCRSGGSASVMRQHAGEKTYRFR
jgi:hypothetical protein